MYTLPAPSTATAVQLLSCAFTASPPSPAYAPVSAVLCPAKVEIYCALTRTPVKVETTRNAVMHVLNLFIKILYYYQKMLHKDIDNEGLHKVIAKKCLLYKIVYSIPK